MLLQTVYTVTAGWPGLDKVALPLDVRLTDRIRASLNEYGDGDVLRLFVDRSVDASRLAVVSESGRSRQLPNGGHEAVPCLRLLGDEGNETDQQVRVVDLVSAVSFLADVPLALSRPMQEDRFIPEVEADERRLEELGTDLPCLRTTVQLMSGGRKVPIDADRVSTLFGRAAGVRLYADALKLPLDVARFRELWRVLESAFKKDGDQLVDCLESYQPATDLGFNRQELDDLLHLRGRASHAQSRQGVVELIRVERECAEHLPRLKQLVETVILTKKSWGYRTTVVEELFPRDG